MSVSGTPRVAVVIPCFNEGVELREAVASVLRDAVPRELVVVDDGSTGSATRQILGELEGEGVRLLRQANTGLAGALMSGVNATSARYLFRLDADDVASPGAIEALADALDADPGAAVAWGDLETFGLTRARVPMVPVLDAWYVTYASNLPASALFRRDALTAVGGWRLAEGHDALSDWDLWMALAEHGYRGVYEPRVVYRYRRDRGGMLEESLDRYAETYDELRRRHPRLFAERNGNRHRSPAPRVIKVAAPLVDRLPRVPRLYKVWIVQVLANVFWSGGFRVTVRIVREGMALRLGRR